MALEEEAKLLKAGVHAGLIDADKGTAALVVFAQLKQMGANFEFGDFLIERKIVSRMALDAIKESLANKERAVRTISKLGDFELLELLGEGETGAVFKAKQLSMNRIVAVKILSPSLAEDDEALGRFQNEARAVARLNHPHIIQGIHVGIDENLYYFAMELVDGGSVRSLLEEYPNGLPEKRALELCLQTAEALYSAHSVGLLHRDIKPENLLLTNDGNLKMADLGISLRFEKYNDPQNDANGVRLIPALGGQTATGEFWGSPPYVAPEVVEGRGADDPRSDLYSLGATFFEMLTGRPPFVGDTPEQTLRLHLSSPPPDLDKFRPDASQITKEICLKLLGKSPDSRYQDASLLAEALEKALVKRRRGKGLGGRRRNASPLSGRGRKAGSYKGQTQSEKRQNFDAKGRPPGRKRQAQSNKESSKTQGNRRTMVQKNRRPRKGK